MIGRGRFREPRRSVLGSRGLRVGLRSVFLGRLSPLLFFFTFFSGSLSFPFFFLEFPGETTWVEGFSLGSVLEFSPLSYGGEFHRIPSFLRGLFRSLCP